MAATWVGLTAALLAGGWMLIGGGVSRGLMAVMGLASVVLAPLLVSGLLAANPWVSIVGLVGQHNGWLLWLLGWCWFALGALSGRAGGRGTATAIKVLAVAGSLAAAASLVDAVGAFAWLRRFSDEPSGFLESSIAVGQFLLVTAGAAIAWTLAERPERRLLPGLASGLILAGIGVSMSNAALVGVAVAAAVAGAMWVTRQRDERARKAAALAPPLLATAALSALVALAVTTRPGWLSSLLNLRPTLWRAAWEAFLGAPLLGRGPEQFSAWVDWTITPAGGLSVQGGFDPHHAGLALLVAGGVLGLVAALVSGLAVAQPVLRSVATGGFGTPVWLFAGLAGWLVAIQTSWTDPLSAMCAAFLAGLLAGRAYKDEPLRPAGARTGWALATVAVVVAVALTPSALREISWSLGSATAASLTVEDPTYAYEHIRGGLLRFTGDSASDAELLESLDRTFEGIAADAVWHVDIALTWAELTQTRAVMFGREDEVALSKALAAGVQADPGSSIWPTIGALEAQRSGTPEQAREYAAQAIELGVPEQVEAILQPLVE